MLHERTKHFFIWLALFLMVFDAYLFSADWKNLHHGLIFAALDVGQGDALYIESPFGAQVLVDGGPARNLVGPLRQVMPPLDRDIDAVIITNPDRDHIGGLLEILKSYKVHYVFEPGTVSDSKIFQNLKEEMKKQNIPDILVRRGMKLRLGAGADITFLFPDRDVSAWATNDGSTVAKLSYGNVSVMLTGDAPVKTEKIILAENPAGVLQSAVLKVGHHGSRTSSSSAFVSAVAPRYAVISAGRNNKYGHPHAVTLALFRDLGIPVLRTDISGSIVLVAESPTSSFSIKK